MCRGAAFVVLLNLVLASGCGSEQKRLNAPVVDSIKGSVGSPAQQTWLAPKSGLTYQSADTQQLQADEFSNPGMLAVDAGERLWRSAPTDEASACADCHQSMRGVALSYPKVAEHNGHLENLEQRINRCRSEQQQQPKLAYESSELLALSAYLGQQSNGMQITAQIAPEARAYFEAGKDYYYQRRGQMNLACHHCHELNAGRQLRGDLVSQGHGNGYPAYRLEWQSVGSLQRRLRFCNVGVRAEPHAYGAQEYVNLELYLRWRAAGLTVETPAVRR